MTYQSKEKIACRICGSMEAVARKLCRPCYNDVRKAGKLVNYPILKPEDVFESKIKKSASCWVWQGTKNKYGYGIFLLPGEIAVRAHRYAYEFFSGKKIPKGKIIMHSCDNPPCVNPDHLNVATKAKNNADTAIKRHHHYGLDHWNGKLSEKQVSEIRASYKNCSQLAKQYDVCYSHLWRIKNGYVRT